MLKLSPTVQELQAHSPDWYAELYEKETPAAAPWPVETWALMISSGFCRKERGTADLRSSGSFALSPRSASNDGLMKHLQDLQQEIRAMRPQSDDRRFRFAPPPGPSSALLDNGALLTFSAAGEAARGPLAVEDTRRHETAHGSDPPPDTAAAGVEDAPAKRPRISVAAVSKRILEGATEAPDKTGKEKKAEEEEEADGDAAAGPGAGEAAGTAPKAKARAKAKGRPKKPGVCPLRCQHDGDAKTFRCYWDKLNCKSFQYTSAKEKKKAQEDAKAWLQKTAERHGCTVPAITF